MNLEIVAKKLFDVPYFRGSGADCELEETEVYQTLLKALEQINENKNPFFIRALDVCLKDLVSSISIDYNYISYTSVFKDVQIEENACSMETGELLSFCKSMDLFNSCQVREDEEAIEDKERDTNISKDVLIDIVTTTALNKIDEARKWLEHKKHDFSTEFWYGLFDAQSEEEKEQVDQIIQTEL